jgi:MYXO-CTERM domain-containing protein
MSFGWGLRAGAALAVLLTGASLSAEVINFENLTLPPGSHFVGPVPGGAVDTDPFGGTRTTGEFTSGSLNFFNQFVDYGAFTSWNAFGYSNETDTTTPGFGNQYSTFAGADHTATGAGVFGIAFGYVDNLVTPTLTALQGLPSFTVPAGMMATGAYLTNITYAALSMQNGDAFAEKFGGASGTDPDYLRVKAYGVDAGGNVLGNSPEFYLSDFRFSNSADDYILSSWEWFDLSSLAGAAKVYFNMETSDVGPFGSNTPTYFAIDDISLEAVPEPSSALLAVAAAGMLWRARRRKNSGEPRSA